MKSQRTEAQTSLFQDLPDKAEIGAIISHTDYQPRFEHFYVTD
jgi:hypothetical protein